MHIILRGLGPRLWKGYSAVEAEKLGGIRSGMCVLLVCLDSAFWGSWKVLSRGQVWSGLYFGKIFLHVENGLEGASPGECQD